MLAPAWMQRKAGGKGLPYLEGLEEIQTASPHPRRVKSTPGDPGARRGCVRSTARERGRGAKRPRVSGEAGGWGLVCQNKRRKQRSKEERKTRSTRGTRDGSGRQHDSAACDRALRKHFWELSGGGTPGCWALCKPLGQDCPRGRLGTWSVTSPKVTSGAWG